MRNHWPVATGVPHEADAKIDFKGRPCFGRKRLPGKDKEEREREWVGRALEPQHRSDTSKEREARRTDWKHLWGSFSGPSENPKDKAAHKKRPLCAGVTPPYLMWSLTRTSSHDRSPWRHSGWQTPSWQLVSRRKILGVLPWLVQPFTFSFQRRFPDHLAKRLMTCASHFSNVQSFF